MILKFKKGTTTTHHCVNTIIIIAAAAVVVVNIYSTLKSYVILFTAFLHEVTLSYKLRGSISCSTNYSDVHFN